MQAAKCGLPWHRALSLKVGEGDLYVCVLTAGIRAGWQGLVKASVLSVMTAPPPTFPHHY